MKKRGINVATFNDPSSTSIWLQAVVLVTLYVVLNLFILGVLLMTAWRQKPADEPFFSQETLAAAKGLARMSTSKNSGNAAAKLSEDAFEGDHIDLAFLEEVADDNDNDNSEMKKLDQIIQEEQALSNTPDDKIENMDVAVLEEVDDDDDDDDNESGMSFYDQIIEEESGTPEDTIEKSEPKKVRFEG